jgi:hypothetical protein
VVDQEHPGLVLVAHGPHDCGELGHLGFGQARGRLVEEQEPGLGGERPRDAELALVAVRERTGRLPLARSEAEQLEQLVGPTPRLAGPCASSEGGDLDVLADAQACERAAVLERAREPGAAAPVRTPRRHVLAGELDRPRGREVEAGEDVDERRLPCPVRPDQADDLVAVQLERHVAERVQRLEGTRDGGGPESVSGPPGHTAGLRFCHRVPSGSSSPSASSTSG